MDLDQTILLGAVAYDAKVVTIWEGIREHFAEQGVPMEFTLFSTYEWQVEALLKGHIDIAWNTPLAHVRVRHRTGGKSLSLGMRDSDRDFQAKLLVRNDRAIQNLKDLEGKTLAVGTVDSTQARILPLYFLGCEDVDVSRVNVVTFEGDLGKHGDTGNSELDVLRALHEGRADAGTIGDLVWVNEQAAGRVDTERIKVLWTTRLSIIACSMAVRIWTWQKLSRSEKHCLQCSGRTRSIAGSWSWKDCMSGCRPAKKAIKV